MSNNLLRLTSWNLLNGRSLVDGQADRKVLETAMRNFFDEFQPDVLGIQEVDDAQQRSGDFNQSEIIAELMGAEYWRYTPTLFGTPGEIWSDKGEDSQEASYGIGLISRIEVKKWHMKKLHKAPFGLPLAIPAEKGIRLRYIPDEPRVVLAAELIDGTIIATTHLSFVPGFNILQLKAASKWLKSLRSNSRIVLMGDFNLPWGLAEKFSPFQSLTTAKSYPSWSPKVQFDYILGSKDISGSEIKHKQGQISDHLPISVIIQ